MTTTRHFPEALCEALPTPLSADFCRFKPRRDNVRKGGFENAWHTTLANVYGISRAQLEQRDRKGQRKTRTFVAAGSMAVVLALAAALGMTQFYSQRATRAQRECVCRAVRAIDEGIVSRSNDSDPERHFRRAIAEYVQLCLPKTSYALMPLNLPAWNEASVRHGVWADISAGEARRTV